MSAPKRNFSRGFLPTEDPLLSLPAPFAEWEAVGRDLPKLALSHHLRRTVAALNTRREYERPMSLLATIAHVYVFAPDHLIR